jgi:hypothetical protein
MALMDICQTKPRGFEAPWCVSCCKTFVSSPSHNRVEVAVYPDKREFHRKAEATFEK